MKRKDKIIELAEKLYFDLPFWKKWKVARNFRTNNWDYSKQWDYCLEQAQRMYEQAEFIYQKI